MRVKSREISERDIAINLVIELAESGLSSFSLLGFYDDDCYFLSDLAERLNVIEDKSWKNKLTKVVRVLVNYGVLTARMNNNHKDHIGEPTKQMEYTLKVGKAQLLTRGKTEYTGDPEWEASFLLRNAYPKEQNDCY